MANRPILKTPIFSHHAHLFPAEIRVDGSKEVLLELMAACGIDKCVCFAPFHSQVAQLTDSPNAWLAEELKNEKSLLGFGVVDMTPGIGRTPVSEQVKKIASLGLKGIKLHPAFQKFNLVGDNAFSLYEQAEKEGLFLSFHTGIHWHRIKDYQMLLFDEVAFSFPTLRFSMEHLGGYCFFKEGVAVMLNNSKRAAEHTVYAGLTSVCDRAENRAWYLSDQELSELFWQTGFERSIFGLDFPYNGVEKTKAAIARFSDMDIPEEAKAAILGGNLARALGISL